MTGPEGGGPLPPLVLFDRDSYMYGFSSVVALASWFEPLMQEEMACCFDSSGRAVSVHASGSGWDVRLAVDDPDDDALRAHARAFLGRFEPDKLSLAELPIPAMVEALASLEGYAIA